MYLNSINSGFKVVPYTYFGAGFVMASRGIFKDAVEDEAPLGVH